MKPAGLKTTEPRNSTDYRSGLSLSIASTNSDQLLWVSVAFGVIWKKEETRELILEENESMESCRESAELIRSPVGWPRLQRLV
jgi:hypothetical protein